ncbi:MAG: GrpB family protein, partial [Comamonas sp.]
HSEAAIAAAAQIGYVHFPYKPERMHWFCKPSPDFRTHHLHLVPAGSCLWRERIAFRDALRRSAALCAEYQLLKFKLANQYPYDREAYTDAKSPFIEQVVQTALGDRSGIV